MPAPEPRDSDCPCTCHQARHAPCNYNGGCSDWPRQTITAHRAAYDRAR